LWLFRPFVSFQKERKKENNHSKTCQIKGGKEKKERSLTNKGFANDFPSSFLPLFLRPTQKLSDEQCVCLKRNNKRKKKGG
jgi:hypothetical protein